MPSVAISLLQLDILLFPNAAVKGMYVDSLTLAPLGGIIRSP